MNYFARFLASVPIRAAIGCTDADAASVPHQAATVDLQWLGLETHDSAQYRVVEGQLQRSKKPQQLRGLNDNHNHDLKNVKLPEMWS